MPDRVLTIRQPWAWAVAAGAKTIENRTLRTKYRGLLWIHAGQGWSERGRKDLRVQGAAREAGGAVQRVIYQGVKRNLPAGHTMYDYGDFVRGAVIARAQLVDCHPTAGCCGPWGEEQYADAAGRLRTDVWHWVLEDVERLPEPIPAKGRLGLWAPDEDLAEELAASLPSV